MHAACCMHDPTSFSGHGTARRRRPVSIQMLRCGAGLTRWRAGRIFLLAVLSTFAQGFVTSFDAFGLPPYSYVWDYPANASSVSGFGGSLTYAVSDRFCGKLLPSFDERTTGFLDAFNFVDCKLVRAALNRAFQTWSDNHAYIRFLDVTNICNTSAEDVRADCDVEVLIDVDVGDVSEVTTEDGSPGGARAAFVRQRTQWGGVRSPSNAVHQAHASVEADMFFSNQLCWYLDSTFCSRFHRLDKQFGDKVRLGGQVVIFTLWCLAVFSVVYGLCSLTHKQVKTAQLSRRERLSRRARRIRDSLHRKGSALRHSILGGEAAAARPPPKRRMVRQPTMSRKEKNERQWAAAMELLQRMSVRWMALSLVMCISPLTFYFHIFSPCWDCFDFESAAVHEIGHLLGLHHPDQFPALQRAAAAPMGPQACAWPLSFLTAAGSADNATSAADDDADAYSVMHAFTQNPSEVCLSADDLDGLNYLYPVCANAVPREGISCYKSERNIGWLRFAGWVVLPVLIAMLLLLCLVGLVKRHQVRKLGSFAVKFNQLKEHNHKLLAAMKEADENSAALGAAHEAAVADLEQEMAQCEAHMRSMAVALDHRRASCASAGGATPRRSRRGRLTLRGSRATSRALDLPGGRISSASSAPRPPEGSPPAEGSARVVVVLEPSRAQGRGPPAAAGATAAGSAAAAGPEKLAHTASRLSGDAAAPQADKAKATKRLPAGMPPCAAEPSAGRPAPPTAAADAPGASSGELSTCNDAVTLSFVRKQQGPGAPPRQ